MWVPSFRGEAVFVVAARQLRTKSFISAVAPVGELTNFIPQFANNSRVLFCNDFRIFDIVVIFELWQLTAGDNGISFIKSSDGAVRSKNPPSLIAIRNNPKSYNICSIPFFIKGPFDSVNNNSM